MSDPFSAASGAVGIISLGLQVSQGLITYCSQFKAFDEDVAHISRKAEGLRGVLQVLEKQLRKSESENAPVPAQVRSAVVACEDGLQKLQQMIKKYGNTEPGEKLEDKVRILKKRVLFPFRCDTLFGLRATLDGLQANLDSAVQVLSLETHHRQYELVLSISESTTSSTRDVQGRLHYQTELMESVSTKLDQLVLNIQQQQPDLVREPALLAMLCNQHKGLRNQSAMVIQPHLNPSSELLRRSFCPCPRHPRIIERRIFMRNFSGFWSRKISHLPDCPRHAYAEYVDTLGAKYLYCTRTLGYSIAVAMSITRGAGGFAISPQLNYRAVVSQDSPAFTLLDPSARRIAPAQLLDSFDLILKQLYQLFREGKASPTDVLPNGRTLLHEAIRFSDYMRHSDLLVQLPGTDVARTLHCLLYGLIGAGAKPEECNRWDETILDQLLENAGCDKDISYASELEYLINDLCNLGLVIGPNSIGCGCCSLARKLSTLSNIIRKTGRREVLDVPEIMESIFSQQESELSQLLTRSSSSANKGFVRGRTPLHLSAVWPRGLFLLLEAGADINQSDETFCTPLYYACESRSIEAIQLLLCYDCGLGLRDDPNSCLSLVSNIEDDIARAIFISALANRRQRLQRLARLALPQHEPSHLKLREDQVLDAYAADITAALLRLRVHIEPALMPSPWQPRKTTVYHQTCLNAKVAQLLYEAGFRDVDSIDEDGMTPIWVHVGFSFCSRNLIHYLEVIEWFKLKDVNFLRPLPESEGTALHSFGSAIGLHILKELQRCIYRTTHVVDPQANPFQDLKASHHKLVRDLLTDEFTDSCLCACSFSGCRVITSTLKMVTEWNAHAILDKTAEPFRTEIKSRTELFIIDYLESERERCPWLARDMIRVMTYNELGLTHTCHCDPVWYYGDLETGDHLPKDEIQEIQEEERFLIQQLEELLAEFEAKYAEHTDTLTSFLKNYWEGRMDEVLSEEGSGKDEEVRKMREIGVVVA